MFILACRPCLQVLLVVAADAAVAADLSLFFQSCRPCFQFVLLVAAAAADLSSLLESRRPYSSVLLVNEAMQLSTYHEEDIYM
ncbi:hypothetical protein AHAS_Ahas03G0368800 [Arachis hypogaea]